MSAAAALKKKPAESGEKAAKSARPEADPTASAGMPAYLGGIAGGSGSPAFLQRAPVDSTPPIAEEEPLPDGSIQRLPQDPFPSAEEEETEDQAGTSIQAKLEINTPGDGFEQEADRVADAVTSGGASASVTSSGGTPEVQRKCGSCGKKQSSGGTCPDCAAKVQRKESGSTAPKPTSDVAQAVSRPGPGTPIPERTRAPIEAELGQDLSHVRVHQGSEAAEAASSIGAKAFTHSNHIWLGPGQSADDTALMAHEATHTVQQGSGGSGPALVQRAPADHQHPEDGSAPQGRITGELDREREEQGERDEDEPVPEIDQAEKRAKAAPLESQAKPDTDRPAQEAPKVEQAAGEVQAEVDSPSEPMVEGQSEAPDAGASEAAPPPATADPVGEAMAQVASLPEPEAPDPVEAPPIAQPVDGDGNPLPPEAQSEAMVQAVAAQLQVSREAAYGLRRKAKQQRANAIVLRGNLALIDQHVAEAEGGLTTAHGHMEVRHEALTEADNAHATSEAKAETVAQQAPGVQAEAEEAQGESGPMASEASDSAAQASANKPDDAEGAAEAEANAGQMNSVAGDAMSMDQASSGTQQRAVQLQDDAAQAKEKNAQARTSIDAATSSAEQTDAKLVEMDGQASQARGELEPLTGTPDAAEAEAQRLDDAAAAADQRVDSMAARLLQVQDQYVSDMSRVPGSETLAEQNQGQIQRTEDPAAPAAPAAAGGTAPPAFAPRGYEGRRKVELPTFSMGPPLTEAQRAEQAAAAARAEEARNARIRSIQDGAYGNFNEMDGLDKAGVALDILMQDAFAGASNIRWPDFSAGSVGTALLNIIDPRGPLNGIMGGLSKVASGTLNLFDMDQWSRDPLGNLLKSAADIATGITVILGSIVALLGVVVAISAALIVLSWFTLAPALTPVIAWCTTTGITVGGWTIAVGKLALLFQALLIVKNIVDVMTAQTADELVQNTEQLGSDFSQVGEIGMQMGTAYLGAKGGPGMLDDIATNGMRTVARQEVMEGLKDAALEVVLGEDISGVVGVARMAHGVHGHATGGGGGGSTPHGEDGGAARPPDADAATPLPDGGAEPHPDAAASDTPAPTSDASSPPPDTPAMDAPTPNTDGPAADGPAPVIVEGPTPEPSRPMETATPEPPQPNADATSDTNASARTEPGDAPATPTPTASVDGGGTVARPDVPDRVPTVDGDGGTPRSDSETGPTPRPDGEADGAAALRPDGETDGPRPEDGTDPNAPRPDGEDPASLRESAGEKQLADMSPAERRAEAEQANTAPREDISDPALREAGFDDVTHLDNDMDYIRSEEAGAACRVSNTTCGPTDGDGTIPETGLTGDPALERAVDAAVADGNETTTPRTEDANDPEAPDPNTADANPLNTESDGTTTPQTGTTTDTPRADADADGVAVKTDTAGDTNVPPVETPVPKTAEERRTELADAIYEMRGAVDETTAKDLEARGYIVAREGGDGAVTSIRVPAGNPNGLPPITVRGGSIVDVDGRTPRSIEVTDEMSDFTKRYLTEEGGRWGTAETRQQNYDIASQMSNDGTHEPIAGGGFGSEEYIPASGSTSASYVDITMRRTSDGKIVRIQTVTTTDGRTPTADESAAADRIRAAYPDDVLILVPKGGSYPNDAVYL